MKIRIVRLACLFAIGGWVGLLLPAHGVDLPPREGFGFAAALGLNASSGFYTRSGPGITITGDYSPRRWLTLGLTSGYSSPGSDGHVTTLFINGVAQFNLQLPYARPNLQVGGGHYRFVSNAASGGFLGLGIEVPAGPRWYIPITVRRHSVGRVSDVDPSFVEWRVGIARKLGPG